MCNIITLHYITLHYITLYWIIFYPFLSPINSVKLDLCSAIFTEAITVSSPRCLQEILAMAPTWEETGTSHSGFGWFNDGMVHDG